MAMTHEQYADALLRVARIQQKLQSFHLLPIVMYQELEQQKTGQQSNDLLFRVDQLKSMAAQPSEIETLRRDLRSLQKKVKEFEQTQTTSTGKIRVLREKLSLSQKLEAATEQLNKLKSELNELQPKGFRGMLNRVFQRKRIMELQSQIMRSEREVGLLRLAAPRSRKTKGIKKAIEQQFAEKPERELKRDIYEMKKELELYQKAQQDQKMLQYYQGLANVRGYRKFLLSLRHLRDYFAGRSVLDRMQRVMYSGSIKLVDQNKPTPTQLSFWRSILRPNEMYQEQVNFLTSRVALYKNKVPTSSQAERLRKEISDWKMELEKRVQERKERVAAPKKRRKTQKRKRAQEKTKNPKNRSSEQVVEQANKAAGARAFEERIIRVMPEEIETLKASQIPFTLKENQDRDYEVVEGDTTEKREYKGLQIVVSSEHIPSVEQVLNRSFETDPEIGTVKFADLKKEIGKNVLVKNVPIQSVELLKKQGIPFAAFQKDKVANVYCKKLQYPNVKSILDSGQLLTRSSHRQVMER